MKEETNKNNPKLTRDWTAGTLKRLFKVRRDVNNELLKQSEERKKLLEQKSKLLTEEIEYYQKYIDEKLNKGLPKK